ncbi:LacI family DNA-binding transcriptional regulator [Virgisporangium aurantiacum]|uniref:LacI family transcriptional regulator n=1 Tax=Virgisporangium aurantiacum TaxID=175570 RepID=A0A8J3Z516_9ACTN|nr:LacI family DNA-binding transcriptional regulator [Virgisporangium aurantiacum]GIJ56433.1 LacI family transcriptional regulator [Virgisporangium aurantiacum]
METGQGHRRRPVTIADVAAATGVAPSTVSRALNKPGRVNEVTRQRIQAAARALNYVPDSRARALASGRTRTVAVLVSDVTNPFYFGMIRGTQEQLKAAGYAHLLIDTEDSGEHEAEMLHKMRQSLDGAILGASRLPERALAALAEEIPLVTVNRNVPGVQSVVIDTPAGIAQAVEHLVSLGHRNIVYVSGPERSWSNQARWQAMRSAAERHGRQFQRVGPFPPGRGSGSAAADAVLNTAATACIAFNDLLAIGMLTRLRGRGVRVPEDLSVVGCDDIFGADFSNPPLTTLTAPIQQAGRVAVAMLLSRLDSRGPEAVRRNVVLPTYLTVRESTGPAPDRHRPTSLP